VDIVNEVAITCIDNGMPVVCLLASDVGLTGYESPEEIEANAEACARVEALRRRAGEMMNLGDVASKTVPKMSLLAKAEHGGLVTTRTFIPTRVHEAIGVFGAVSVATACLLPGSVANDLCGLVAISGATTLQIEHPSGYFDITMSLEVNGDEVLVTSAALLRTARLLMKGVAYVPTTVWSGSDH
jgi:4-oxalomesaconate tautomerase